MRNVHEANMLKLLDAAKALSGEAPKAQIAKINNKIVPAIRTRVESAPPNVRKLYKMAHNAFASMADGIKSGDVGHVEFQDFFKELSDLKNKAKAVIDDAEKAATEKAAGGGMMSRDTERMLDSQMDRGRAVLEKYKPFERVVPRSIAKKFELKQVPVLPLVHPWFDRDKLERYKLYGDSFFGYPILKNQVVLGLNSEWVVTEYGRKSDAPKEAAQDVLELLNKKSGKKYFVLGEPRKRGLVTWAWLVTDTVMRQLNTAAVGGHFQLSGWAFPFEADKSINMPASREDLQRQAREKYQSLRG